MHNICLDCSAKWQADAHSDQCIPAGGVHPSQDNTVRSNRVRSIDANDLAR